MNPEALTKWAVVALVAGALALIVNSAIQSGASTLWTEDLTDGQQFGTVTVRNPFA